MALSQKISLLPDNFVHYRLNRSGQLTQGIRDKDFRFFIPWNRLWDNLTKYNLQHFTNAYTQALTRELSWTLGNREAGQKRQLLQYFNQHLSQEAKSLFGYGNQKAKISLIIPVYNVAEFLPECLDSCLNQTLKEIEIICIDDGSTDNGLEILNEYAQKDSRIKVIHQENHGLSITRNNAIKIATGEYIQYLDSDDYLEPDTCECLYLYSKIYNLDMLSFAAIEFKNDTRLEFEEPYHCVQWLPEKFMPAFTWKDVANILPQLAVTSPLTIYRHQYLIDNNISWVNKKIAYEDTPFFTESLLKGAYMGALPIKFYHKRVHGEAITQNMCKNFPDYCWIIQHTLKKIKAINPNETIFIQYFYMFLKKAYLNYLKFDTEHQNKNIDALFNLCFDVQKEYHLPLPNDIHTCCKNYLKNLKFIQKQLFSLHTLWTFWKTNKYTFNPIKISFHPFTLSLLGVNLYQNKSFFIPKNKKNDNCKPNDFCLCFDNLTDALAGLGEAYIFFQWLQKQGIPSKYVIHPQNPLVSQIYPHKDIILSENRNFFTNCGDILSKSKHVITSFGLSDFDRHIKKLSWIKYIFVDNNVEHLKNSLYKEKNN